MHLIDAKCNNRIITSLFHFALTLATQNEIKKNQNVIIITLQNVLQHTPLKNRKFIVCRSNIGPDLLKITKLPSQHSIDIIESLQ